MGDSPIPPRLLAPPLIPFTPPPFRQRRQNHQNNDHRQDPQAVIKPQDLPHDIWEQCKEHNANYCEDRQVEQKVLSSVLLVKNPLAQPVRLNARKPPSIHTHLLHFNHPSLNP